ncbi:hypothetical protein [Paludibaculum fermentans]|uniref:hypothetical protein n=1 Tax=Paludibaculum fermentans TaxID=1473598 RepID=UPI003EB76DFA
MKRSILLIVNTLLIGALTVDIVSATQGQKSTELPRPEAIKAALRRLAGQLSKEDRATTEQNLARRGKAVIDPVREFIDELLKRKASAGEREKATSVQAALSAANVLIRVGDEEVVPILRKLQQDQDFRDWWPMLQAAILRKLPKPQEHPDDPGGPDVLPGLGGVQVTEKIPLGRTTEYPSVELPIYTGSMGTSAGVLKLPSGKYDILLRLALPPKARRVREASVSVEDKKIKGPLAAGIAIVDGHATLCLHTSQPPPAGSRLEISLMVVLELENVRQFTYVCTFP